MANAIKPIGLWRRAMDFVAQRELVGRDKGGNAYYRYFVNDRASGSRVERREVTWNTLYIMYNPHEIPAEWRMWLRKLRQEPPTDAEMARSESKMADLKSKVAVIDEQERLRRLRMESMGLHAQQASNAPDMSSFISQNMPVDAARAAAAASQGAAARPAAAKPGSVPQEEGPQGTGNSFTPGSWRPGK